MRQIILDTETTGLNPRTGDRIIEVGCIELMNRRPTGNTFHHYVNPGRDSDPGALAVHGLTTDFLKDKPKFEDIVDALCDFVAGAEILIHNASFDVAFLDEELARVKRPGWSHHCDSVTDTLAMARELHPGKRNSLDSLCERYGVSNAHRTLHGALLDAELLAEVYLAMTRGQESLVIDIAPRPIAQAGWAVVDRSLLIVVRADDAEEAAHRATLEAIAKESRKTSVWAQLAMAAAKLGNQPDPVQ
ncbi:MAG: DNA polymerase III subunit epsilon [Burkholderiaceae bacterium]